VSLLASAACGAVLPGTQRPPLLIDISCLPGPQQQTRRCMLLQRSTDGTDGRTDGQIVA